MHIGRFIEIDKLGPPPDPQQHQTLVRHDPGQPRREFRLAVVLIEMGVSFRKRVLHLVFCVPAVAQKEGRQVHALRTVPAQQFPQCVFVSVAR